MILGINFAPEIISTAVYSTGLARWLAAAGHQVRVVTAQPYYPGWKVFAGHPHFRYASEDIAERLHVTHCPLYVPAQPTGARRILHHASFALAAAPVLLWHALWRRPQAVIVIAPSLMSGPVGWLAARLAGGKALLHIQDLEVDAAFATGLLRRDSRVGAVARAFERFVLRRFDAITSISAPMIAKIVGKGVPAGRVFEFRNWADISGIRPIDGISPLRAELGITTRHVALYSGNIANKQGLDIIVATAKALRHRDDLTFVICGEGSYLAELKALAEGVPSIRFFPLQPRERLSDCLGMASVHLLPQIAGASDLVLPSKLANMLASGRPVIATVEAGTAIAGEVEGCGEITPPGDSSALAAAIERLLDDPGRSAMLGRNARIRAERNWNQDEVLRQFTGQIETLCGAG